MCFFVIVKYFLFLQQCRYFTLCTVPPVPGHTVVVGYEVLPVPGHTVVVGYEVLPVLLPGPVRHLGPHLVHVPVVGVQQVGGLTQENHIRTM